MWALAQRICCPGRSEPRVQLVFGAMQMVGRHLHQSGQLQLGFLRVYERLRAGSQSSSSVPWVTSYSYFPAIQNWHVELFVTSRDSQSSSLPTNRFQTFQTSGISSFVRSISMSLPSSVHDPGAPEILSGKDSKISVGAGENQSSSLKPDQGGHINTADTKTPQGSSPDSIAKTLEAGKTEGGSFPAADARAK